MGGDGWAVGGLEHGAADVAAVRTVWPLSLEGAADVAAVRTVWPLSLEGAADVAAVRTV
eukprot:gene54914-63354_t